MDADGVSVRLRAVFRPACRRGRDCCLDISCSFRVHLAAKPPRRRRVPFGCPACVFEVLAMNPRTGALRVAGWWAVMIWTWLLAPVASADGAELLGQVVLAGMAVGSGVQGVAQADWRGLGQLGLASGAAVGASEGLQALTDREGPDGSPKSFPSSHSALAFTLAGHQQRRHGGPLAVAYWAGAALVGWSRVAADAHRWPDVLVGAGLGMASSWWLVSPRVDAAVGASPGSEAVSLAVRLRW